MDREREPRSQQKYQPTQSYAGSLSGDDPASRLQAIKRELDELKRKREEEIVATYYQPEETRRILTKTDHPSRVHHSPKFRHEFEHKPLDISPQLDISGDLEHLQQRQKALRAEFFAEDVKATTSSRQYTKVSPVGVHGRARFDEPKGVDISGDKFDAMFDKYSDKLLEETPIQKKFDDLGGSTFEHKKEGNASGVRDLFKVEPNKPSTRTAAQESNIFENIGGSNRQAGNEPQPFMFKNKETKPTTTTATAANENKFAKNAGKGLGSKSSAEDEFEV